MTQMFDIPVLLWIQNNLRSDILTPFWKGVTFCGDKGWFFIALALFFLIFKKTRRMGFASIISVAIGALLTNVILKNLVARIRPFNFTDTIIPLAEADSYSFPSGHTCASFAVALVLLRYDKKIGIPAVIFASMVAFSRLYLGVHYPTDVIGGFLVALLSSIIACFIIKPKKHRRPFGR